MLKFITKLNFPKFTGMRCLMMPYIQGDPSSVPKKYRDTYSQILKDCFINKGDIGYLTIDESIVNKGKPHRASRAKFSRALHTEAGLWPNNTMGWGTWGGSNNVTLNRDTAVLIASNLKNTCAVWDAEEKNTSEDGDIGHLSEKYPYETAKFLGQGEVYKIGILTPHESLPVNSDTKRQFLRIISSGVHGREPYFTPNEIMGIH